jgi:hypothetical protein
MEPFNACDNTARRLSVIDQRSLDVLIQLHY